MVIVIRKLIFPVLIAFVGQEKFGSGAFGQFTRAGHKISVDVGLSYGDDLHVFKLGGGKIRLDIPARIVDYVLEVGRK